MLRFVSARFQRAICGFDLLRWIGSAFFKKKAVPVVAANQRKTMTKDASPASSMRAFDDVVRSWIIRYGAAQVVDTIQTCSLEWSYTGNTDLTHEHRFRAEIERRLEEIATTQAALQAA
jgi:hypothetical protein